MKKLFSLSLLLAALSLGAAPTPPAEQLLPPDTLGVFTIPDFGKAKTAIGQSHLGRFWNDPEMKPFREKLGKKWQTDIVEALERELGIRFAEYLELAQGQLTVAITSEGWEGKSGQMPGFVFLVDSRDKKESLQKQLAALQKKWVDSGKAIKRDKIRDVEFSTLALRKQDIGNALKKVFPGDPGPGKDEELLLAEENKPTQLLIGQSDSLLLIGTSSKLLEKILARQSGAGSGGLAETPAYVANHNLLFRDSLGHGWVNVQPLVAALLQKLSESPNKSAITPEKVVNALGLKGLKSVALSFQNPNGGLIANFFVNAPAAERRGLLKLLNFESKDAGPPSFVPADAVKFNRFRLDAPKAFATLESMVAEISPEMGGIVQMMLNSAGKDKDPNFDFKKSFIANLGDDFIMYEKAPRGATLAELNAAPSLILIGSGNPEQLAVALKTAGGMLPADSGTIKEREFLGRKIFSLPLPPTPQPDGKTVPRSLNYSASRGYLALSTDNALLEEYLRSAETRAKPLSESAGLLDAAQTVGGMNKGLFGYENNRESIRFLFDTLRKDPQALEKLVPNVPMSQKANSARTALKEWTDFSLLPPYERVAKYFSVTVYGAAVSSEGLMVRSYSPLPAELK